LVGRAIVSEWQAVTFNLFLSRCLTMYSIAPHGAPFSTSKEIHGWT
jgi:hypothetical protein